MFGSRKSKPSKSTERQPSRRRRRPSAYADITEDLTSHHAKQSSPGPPHQLYDQYTDYTQTEQHEASFEARAQDLGYDDHYGCSGYSEYRAAPRRQFTGFPPEETLHEEPTLRSFHRSASTPNARPTNHQSERAMPSAESSPPHGQNQPKRHASNLKRGQSRSDYTKTAHAGSYHNDPKPRDARYASGSSEYPRQHHPRQSYGARHRVKLPSELFDQYCFILDSSGCADQETREIAQLGSEFANRMEADTQYAEDMSNYIGQHWPQFLWQCGWFSRELARGITQKGNWCPYELRDVSTQMTSLFGTEDLPRIENDSDEPTAQHDPPSVAFQHYVAILANGTSLPLHVSTAEDCLNRAKHREEAGFFTAFDQSWHLWTCLNSVKALKYCLSVDTGITPEQMGNLAGVLADLTHTLIEEDWR
jgi:hypothetical protein